MILANACTIFVSSAGLRRRQVALPNRFDKGAHSRNRVVERFHLRQVKSHGAVFAGRQDTIQTEAQSAAISPVKATSIAFCVSAEACPSSRGFQRKGGGIAGALRLAGRIAGLPLWEAATPFFACFFRCHQTTPVHYREQVNYAAMRDTRQRMVSI